MKDKPKSEPYKLLSLSTDFVVHCRHDLAKKSILLPRIILQGLCVWPDSSSDAFKRWTTIAVLIGMSIMGAGHFGYVWLNITDIAKMTSACTTLAATTETVAKLATMFIFRDPLNRILGIIWHDFWPANIASKQRQAEIRFRSNYVTAMCCIFFSMAFVSSAQFMSFPLINSKTKQLPLESWYPFDFQTSPIYEMMYIWQWFLNQVIVSTLSGFDAFFNSIVTICACQFQILQDVLESMCDEAENANWKQLFEGKNKSNVNKNDIMIKCVQHHLQLINICNLVESAFTHMVFLQFFFSTLAMCVSCVALVSNPALFEHMLSYAVAHLLQFFIYCSVGNELTYQSGMVADAIYNCNWQNTFDPKFRMGMIMILQRAQTPESLTVAGLMQLGYENFVATLKLSFSFYTLLKSFV